ncbi:MAG TPA: transposase [Clostridiaceae bacterium]|jgi:putative transposase|nr:transposase [Clostridiaceae bacterium]
MPRQARRFSSTGVYHIMLRGINQQQLMEDREDNEKFLEVLSECKLICGYKLYAYCLMGNHIHLLMKVENEPLDKIFKRICGRYVYWYNTKYKRVGHLFQDRFRSEAIEDEEYLLSVLRYIHQNPVEAGLTKNVGEYPYSSYNCYMEPQNNLLVDVDFILTMINRKQLEELHKETSRDICLDVMKRSFYLTDEQAKEIIWKIAKCKNASEFQKIDKKIRNYLIKRLSEEGLTIRQISRLTGVSKGIVERCKNRTQNRPLSCPH